MEGELTKRGDEVNRLAEPARGEQFVIFRLDEYKCALALSATERVFRAVEVVPLPKAPQVVSGIINLGGQILPVLNIRRRFRRPERDLVPDDRFILARTSARRVVLWVDAVEAVVEERQLKTTPVETVVPGTDYVAGVGRLGNGIVLIHDLDKFLSLEEGHQLQRALGSVSP